MTVLAFLSDSLSFMRPFQGDTFFASYLQTLSQIKAQDGLTLAQLSSLHCCLLYSSLHFLYQMLAPLTPRQRTLHFDVLSFIMRPEFNILGPLLYGSLLYYLYRMYFTSSEVNNTLLAGILFRQNVQFFLNPHTTSGEPIPRALKAKMRLIYNATQCVLLAFGKPRCSDAVVRACADAIF